jgi:hypothetical protein
MEKIIIQELEERESKHKYLKNFLCLKKGEKYSLPLLLFSIINFH